jgi:phosphoribosylformylglycinamidine synthase
MRAGVITFPGSNCDGDCSFSLGQLEGVEVSRLWHKDTASLGELDLVVLPGGFSYGDYLRTGAMAAISPIMSAVKEYASRGGRVFGICNGFQILCESGLLPGALLQNENQQFICKNVYIKTDNSKALQIPIAHGEGRYFADDATLKHLENNKQILFRYCDEHGNVGGEGNPNGSTHDIAGICNDKRNVVGMMPHPERATSSVLSNIDGKEVFEFLGLSK